jgi:quinohemoprotein amine dehydrogenase
VNYRLLAALPLLFATALPAQAADAVDVEALLRQNCAACHADPADPSAPLSRMGAQRKTPEGWEMTLRRMQLLHKVPFAGADGAPSEEVFATLVRHFADTQGLAPAESAPFRYILERRHNTIDTPEDPEYAVMCSRCHSIARVGLQRRTEDEWGHLVQFHLAQFPTTEFQAGGRDRDWLGIATGKMVPMLGRTYPLDTPDWQQWQRAAKPALDGRWRLAGRMPGSGDFDGVMRAEPAPNGGFTLQFEGRFASGEALAGSGAALVYTGYEWRGSLELGGQRYLQVLAASADGARMQGRMFLADNEERGIDLSAWKDRGKPQLVAVSPAQLRQGGSATLVLSGSALEGAPDLGAGLRVEEVLSQDADRVVLKVSAAADAPTGARRVRLGKAALDDALVVYSRIDRLEVTPAYAVGRVGGTEGSQPEVQARFEALAWANGADAQPGTADDLRIGMVNAEWSVAPWDEKAAADEDLKFAGQMDKDSGVFTPAAAGPNPQRKYQTNNAGALKVLAAVKDGDNVVNGEGRLLVTVQRWNNPPIR